MINLSGNWGYRWHAARLIQQRDLRSMLLGRGVYIVLSLALLAAVLILRNYLSFVDENGLLILSGAFNFPIFAIIFLTALFLALSSVATIAREREQGTMEALFYAPVDAIAYILGKYLAQVSTYLVMVVIYILCFLLYAFFTNFTFPVSLIWIGFLSVLVASDVIAFGIFISAWSGRVRTAIFLFLTVIVLLILVQFGQQFLAAVPANSSYYSPVQFLQGALDFINRIVIWLSPFSYLTQGMEAIRRGSFATYWLIVGASVIFTLLFLALSVDALERKGVRK